MFLVSTLPEIGPLTDSLLDLSMLSMEAMGLP